MGYYARGEGYNELGPDLPMMTPEQSEECWKDIKPLLMSRSFVKEHARGFSSGPGVDTDHPYYFENMGYSSSGRRLHYSWCDMKWLNNEAENFFEVLDHLGFDLQFDDDGNLISMYYNNKVGQEDLFLQESAPYWEPGAVVDWTGEDSSVWRSVLPMGREKQGRVVYD